MNLGLIQMSPRTVISLALAISIAIFVGCGNASDAGFSKCGNGVLNHAEQCDDGNTSDTDACTSACLFATCGDGVIEAGVEECDGFNLNGRNCSSLGLGAGDLTCTSDCRLDSSGCGAPFTPTPTATGTATPLPPTPTATSFPTGQPTLTPTFTATPTPLPCGDGLLESSETCDSCPADCVPSPCDASGETFPIEVDFAFPAARSPTSATVLLAYRSSVISLPGSKLEQTVRQRVVAPAPSPFLFTPFDLDYALRVVISRSEGLSSGLLFTATFDGCSGAAAPHLEDFDCSVQGCAGSTGAISDCSCTVIMP